MTTNRHQHFMDPAITTLANRASSLPQVPQREAESGYTAADDTRATAIATTLLETAVHFVVALEQREIAAGGGSFQPNVTNLCGWIRHWEEATELGWMEERDFRLDDLAPRSQWKKILFQTLNLKI
ncbi:hypothetical protein GGR50DRAFT_692101 [Xylaria sp. CBS 124048]|nr:hypothetical protein GGR50DRAFT_692101 [Xylaria sp. CBS 124048]